MIAHGEFPENATIPVEADIVAMLGVSRTVVREAIKVLSGKGMLRTARRYGTRVLPSENWKLLDPDVIRWQNHNSPAAARLYAESTQIRMIVEPEAAALAAEHGSFTQKQRILEAANHIQPEPYGFEAMIAADYFFHATILEATGNMMLAQIRGLIHALLQFSYTAGASVMPDPQLSQINHLRVAEAIRESDPTSARLLMREMLQTNVSISKKLIEKNTAQAR